MERARSRDLFIVATESVLEYTRSCVTNELPDVPRFRVYTNQSADVAPDGSSRTAFPEDSLPAGEFHGPMTGVEAIVFLWREGRVSQWIDVSVIGAEDRCTLLEVLLLLREVRRRGRENVLQPGHGPVRHEGADPAAGLGRGEAGEVRPELAREGEARRVISPADSSTSARGETVRGQGRLFRTRDPTLSKHRDRRDGRADSRRTPSKRPESKPARIRRTAAVRVPGRRSFRHCSRDHRHIFCGAGHERRGTVRGNRPRGGRRRSRRCRLLGRRHAGDGSDDRRTLLGLAGFFGGLAVYAVFVVTPLCLYGAYVVFFKWV